MKDEGRRLIAGVKSVDDWNQFRTRLKESSDPSMWREAFEKYFYERLKTRYLGPIATLQENGTYIGEGFSIVAIQCTLIEFLASTLNGSSYRFWRRGDPPLGAHEYADSSKMFIRFLSENEPFNAHFDKPAAQDFYAGVRCGLLHEARTRDGWTIWAKSQSSKLIDAQQKIVFRDDFQDAILGFVERYGRILRSTVSLQEAFVRKFDSLCL